MIMKSWHLVIIAWWVPMPFLLAQIDSIINHKDVIWIAEMSYYTSFDEQQLANTVFDLIHSGAVNCSSMNGKNLSTDQAKALLYSTDTVVVIYPGQTTFYEEQIAIVHNQLTPNHITNFLIKQHWWYNQQTKEFNTLISEVAPVVTVRDSHYYHMKELLWLSPPLMIEQTLVELPKIKGKTNHFYRRPYFNRIKILKGKTIQLLSALLTYSFPFFDRTTPKFKV